MTTEESGLYNPQIGIPTYVRSGDGVMYREVPQAGGECDYVLADQQESYVEVTEGKFVVAQDAKVMAQQRESQSHKKFFDGLQKSGDPKDARRVMKRQDALQRQFEAMAIDRVLPPQSPNVRMVTDEQFLDMRAAYMREFAGGRGRQSEFQPLTSYQNKLVTKSGAVVRPLYKGEVGMLGSVVVCLEPGYGTGSSAQVPEKVTAHDEVSGSGERNDRPDDGG
jgi:hypothetical protein